MEEETKCEDGAGCGLSAQQQLQQQQDVRDVGAVRDGGSFLGRGGSRRGQQQQRAEEDEEVVEVAANSGVDDMRGMPTADTYCDTHFM
ncbi:hypothetical protein PHYSODRAFT_335925 [Phytophthora sojae]|uniref:Uncharacterized protein n=1 Tax=Phytophthora sojae (strain P6497) TaxID=1094619 RepID=G4ZR56_PHYSP|nr:hypothetical protein PHYSODRAFT_335925 [Phytophthora sojae]EGZ14278.1 hypothetical protein PHYSODRAFT_335925 [Phytophthora sojae]|eukprot:XP_009531707.1 hypothetical protein PHYSODRAFT_335925 [Phytophthora sojae]